MKILAIDLGTRCGYCLGDSSASPSDLTISGWRLKKPAQDAVIASANLAVYLNDLLAVACPDLIALENFIRPEGMKSAQAAEMAVGQFHTVFAIAACHGIPVEHVATASVRVHFCGRASANPPRSKGSPRRTSREADRDREETKMMVWKRAVALGYFSRGEAVDYDKSDAAALFDWAAATKARSPRPFLLHGQVAP